MHEASHHQASGLDYLSLAHSARLVAMVRNSDETAELPLLWRLCLTWVTLGYPVTVLDAGSVESSDNPGLAQLLECAYDTPHGSQNASAWKVIPAASGLQSLRCSAGATQQVSRRLAALFADDDIVIVYANADTLLSLLPGQALQPLLVVSSAPESLLKSYWALKRLLSAGHLAPLVVDPSPPAAKPHTAPGASAGAALANCAKNFLGHDLKWIRLQLSQDDSAPASDFQRMALRILENALPLSDRWTHMALPGTKMQPDQFSRSH